MGNPTIPRYLQIEYDLKEKIERGDLKIGNRLTEKRLAKVYKVSRSTLRKAFSLLISESCLCQIPGRGAFVTSKDDAKKIREGLKVKKG